MLKPALRDRRPYDPSAVNDSNDPAVAVSCPPLADRSVRIWITPPMAESPYIDAPGPLDASMRRIDALDSNDQSMSPDSTSATGWPSTRSLTYSASPPPKNPRAEITGRPA